MLKRASLLDSSTVEIRFDFDWETLEVVKSIPNRKFKSDYNGKYWTCPLSLDAYKILSPNGFSFTPELTAAFNQHAKPIPTANQVKSIQVNDLKKTLFPFQEKGVALIEARNGRALLADEMGLGKTIQALAYLHLHPDKRPAVILCPAHLKLNWAKEIRDTLPEGTNTVEVLFGARGSAQLTGDIIIVNYDILHRGWEEEIARIAPQVLIVDEAHYIKSNKALRTKSTKKIAKKIPHIICLTGTPIVNRPIEGFNIAQIIDRSVFPDWWKYVHHYCAARHNGFGWDFSGSSHKDELHQKLIDTIMIRRLKKDVLPDLPDKIYSFVPIQITNGNEYAEAEDDFIEFIKNRKGKAAAERASGALHLAKIETLKQLAVKGKMKDAITWIENFIEDNGKLVVFATHKITIDALMEVFKDVAVKIDGSTSSKNRETAITRFQNEEAVRLFIGNIQAAGTGITLTAASSVAFLELPWTSGELSQAEDRCHRIGQKDSVNVYYLLANGTIEEKIARLLDSKKKILNAVLDGGEMKEIKLFKDLMQEYEEEVR